jgi:2-(1,2-epoxy-1,2-dihydrophenyl)acetyl-CoA isomerase
MSELLRSEIDDGVATITLTQPDNMNALSLRMLDVLMEALDGAATDDSVRVVVLAAEGKVFCAGADRAEMIEREPAEWEPIVDRYLDPVRAIVGMDKPVVARLHGDTVGGGLGLAMACDFRVAVEGIRLGAPFVRIGLAGCDMSAGYFLPRLIGLGPATEMMMTGRLVKADEALAMGLVHRAVAAAQLDEELGRLVGKLRAGPPVALAFTKRAIRRSLDRDMNSEFDYEIFAQVQCIQTEDHREGVKAFFDEKRAPVFRGK